MLNEALSKYKGKTVMVTGHTGFVGGWLALFLKELGAHVIGYSIEPPSVPNFFQAAAVSSGITSVHGDIRDAQTLHKTIADNHPEMVFHLAGQTLVLNSYQEPLSTIEVNVMGTAILLDEIRRAGCVKSVLNVTSDKCYDQRGHGHPFVEDDPLGGNDPYSASKAASEIVTAAYRSSFLKDAGIALSTARAGNIVGGGDWGTDRLIPDIVRSIFTERPLLLRHPEAVRPWQHVLDVVNGYLLLCSRMTEEPLAYSSSWNFGPEPQNVISVNDIVSMVNTVHPGIHTGTQNVEQNLREHSSLLVESSKARKLLGWKNFYSIEKSITEAMNWYTEYYGHRDTVGFMGEYSRECIREFVGLL